MLTTNLLRRLKMLKFRHNTTIFLLALSLVALSVFNSQAERSGRIISMYVGEVKVLELKGIERVAIGNPKVASNTILPQGQLVLLADDEGVTTMHIWLKDGTEKDFEVVVNEKQTLASYQELVQLLADIPGITVNKIGESTVIKGSVALENKFFYDRIISRYKGVLDLVQIDNITSDIASLLKDVPSISVSEVGGSCVIAGEVSKEYEQVIKVVKEKYPNIINLTRVHETVAAKMVYMKVQIMEMNKSLTDKVGIKWNSLGIAGPSLQYGVEKTFDDNSTILNSSKDVPGALLTPFRPNLTNANGYFGIATGVSSLINLYEKTGDAVVIAEPRLSTRSGGSAKFLAGGEYPVPTVNENGATNVEFKKYGISLNVEPLVDDQGNILAHIETEISTIDQSQVFNDIPGVLTRRTSTDVSLRAEQTLIIAGLVQDLANKDYEKFKWLSDLPILGELFKSKSFLNQKTELVIFITPYIYDAASELNIENIEKGNEIRAKFQEIIEGEKILE